MTKQMGPCIGGCRLPENHLGHCCVNPELVLFVQCTKCLWHLRDYDCPECGNEGYVRTDIDYEAIRYAWTIEGPVPSYHRREKAELKKHWPRLWQALDAAFGKEDDE